MWYTTSDCSYSPGGLKHNALLYSYVPTKTIWLVIFWTTTTTFFVNRREMILLPTIRKDSGQYPMTWNQKMEGYLHVVDS